ncbi:MAG TPA: hypothetical protein VHT04_13905 [Stellaceae bacterium]|nr:hypothetical protein [Stellaceae bacterium]
MQGMINLLIALAVIAIFAIGLLQALGIIGGGTSSTPPGDKTK